MKASSSPNWAAEGCTLGFREEPSKAGWGAGEGAKSNRAPWSPNENANRA
jgi:hypothetical protein